ncbi:hypothetical protein BDV93DRAFT_605190 [Ceratobasidium sp. AG-I]|nr:hypothetical protein BDV93DRAFT_605190 [Ceratobasidium sp. AG-I]
MPRSVSRRPVPIALLSNPMDTLWEADESLNHLTPTGKSNYASSSRSLAPSSSRSATSQFGDDLRSIFENHSEEDLHKGFPTPPAPVPVKRLFWLPQMSLPIHPAPRSNTASSPSKSTLLVPPRKYSLSPKHPNSTSCATTFPASHDRIVPLRSTETSVRGQPLSSRRPVSPTSSASGSDNEFPCTPPAIASSLSAPSGSKVYALTPPPPAEWEDVIESFLTNYEDIISVPSSSGKSGPPPRPTRRPPPPPQSHGSQISSSHLPSPSTSPRLPPDSLSPTPSTFTRAFDSPGSRPASPTASIDSCHTYASSAFAPSSVIPRKKEVQTPPKKKKKKVPVARGLVIGGALGSLYKA